MFCLKKIDFRKAIKGMFVLILKYINILITDFFKY